MSWIVPRGWIGHLMNALHESGLQGGMEVVEGTCLDNYFIHTKREILVMDEWPEYIVIREHALKPLAVPKRHEILRRRRIRTKLF